jgi:predicted glycoside hydrolase/deacetylase ChbG (UPF0249 family)
MTMQIITNADDFGFCEDTVRATIECFEAGALTSATIMPKMPATASAVAYARCNSNLSFGVHLTFAAGTEEAPVLPPSRIPSLVTEDGRFRPTNTIRLLTLCRQIPIDQIEAEAEAQIAFLVDQGVPVSHVDSHFHLHKLPPFCRALRQVLPKFGIRRVRNVQNIYTKRPVTSPTYWFGASWKRSLMRSFSTTQHFFMDNRDEDSWPDRLLSEVREGTLEVGVHPGYAEAWRDHERSRIKRFTENCRHAGHSLVSWKALPAS